MRAPSPRFNGIKGKCSIPMILQNWYWITWVYTLIIQETGVHEWDAILTCTVQLKIITLFLSILKMFYILDWILISKMVVKGKEKHNWLLELKTFAIAFTLQNMLQIIFPKLKLLLIHVTTIPCAEALIPCITFF